MRNHHLLFPVDFSYCRHILPTLIISPVLFNLQLSFSTQGGLLPPPQGTLGVLETLGAVITEQRVVVGSRG